MACKDLVIYDLGKKIDNDPGYTGMKPVVYFGRKTKGWLNLTSLRKHIQLMQAMTPGKLTAEYLPKTLP